MHTKWKHKRLLQFDLIEFDQIDQPKYQIQKQENLARFSWNIPLLHKSLLWQHSSTINTTYSLRFFRAAWCMIPYRTSIQNYHISRYVICHRAIYRHPIHCHPIHLIANPMSLNPPPGNPITFDQPQRQLNAGNCHAIRRKVIAAQSPATVIHHHAIRRHVKPPPHNPPQQNCNEIYHSAFYRSERYPSTTSKQSTATV